jgi:hypothetical protein
MPGIKIVPRGPLRPMVNACSCRSEVGLKNSNRLKSRIFVPEARTDRLSSRPERRKIMASAAARISLLQEGFSPVISTAPAALRRNRPTQIMPTGAGMLICERAGAVQLTPCPRNIAGMSAWWRVMFACAYQLGQKGTDMAANPHYKDCPG